MFKRILAILLIAISMIIPVTASAAVSIEFPLEIGMAYEGQSITLKPELSGVKLKKLTWTSSNKKVATMKSNKLTAVKEGLCVIKAKYKKIHDEFGLVVLPKSVSLEAGNAHGLPYDSALTYKSSNQSVAKVDSKGNITGVSAGETTVTVSSFDMSLTVAVIVTGSVKDDTDRVASLDCASRTNQIVLVEYEGGSKATVSLHEKKNGQWTEILSTKGYVGKNGIGKTKEGDKKTPTGTYNLSTPFGIKADPGSKQEYLKVTKYHYWCGTSGSEYYNQLIDTRVTERKRTSSDEYLISYKGNYNYCMFVDYNVDGVKGKGSCIFLHCTGSNKYTAGCIAIPEDAMKKVIKWADKGAKIVIKNK